MLQDSMFRVVPCEAEVPAPYGAVFAEKVHRERVAIDVTTNKPPPSLAAEFEVKVHDIMVELDASLM